MVYAIYGKSTKRGGYRLQALCLSPEKAADLARALQDQAHDRGFFFETAAILTPQNAQECPQTVEKLAELGLARVFCEEWET